MEALYMISITLLIFRENYYDNGRYEHIKKSGHLSWMQVASLAASSRLLVCS